jgi:hypothetical protein
VRALQSVTERVGVAQWASEQTLCNYPPPPVTLPFQSCTVQHTYHSHDCMTNVFNPTTMFTRQSFALPIFQELVVYRSIRPCAHDIANCLFM